MTGITCSKMNPKTEHLKSFSQTDLAAVRQTSSTRQKSFILLSLSIMAATTSNKINIKLYHVMVLYLVCTSRSGSIKSYILFSHYTCVASFKTGSFFKIKLQFLCISFYQYEEYNTEHVRPKTYERQFTSIYSWKNKSKKYQAVKVSLGGSGVRAMFQHPHCLSVQRVQIKAIIVIEV